MIETKPYGARRKMIMIGLPAVDALGASVVEGMVRSILPQHEVFVVSGTTGIAEVHP